MESSHGQLASCAYDTSNPLPLLLSFSLFLRRINSILKFVCVSDSLRLSQLHELWLFLNTTFNSTTNPNNNNNLLSLSGNFLLLLQIPLIIIFPFLFFKLLFFSSHFCCRNLYTIDGHMTPAMTYYDPSTLQDHSQHPPYVPPCNFSFLLFSFFFFSIFFMLRLAAENL